MRTHYWINIIYIYIYIYIFPLLRRGALIHIKPEWSLGFLSSNIYYYSLGFKLYKKTLGSSHSGVKFMVGKSAGLW